MSLYSYGTYGQVPQRVAKHENFGWNIIAFGRQNTYPQEIEYAVARSGIASAVTKVFGEFLYGQGFAQGGDIVINSQGETLNKLLMQACQEFAVHAGFSLLTNVNLNGTYTSIECQPFTYVRLCKPDGGDIITSAKISDDWAGESWRNSASPSDAISVDLFDPLEVGDLVEELGIDGLREYGGQLLYATMNSGFYDKAFLDPVIEEVLASGDLAEFDRRYVQNGFSASTVFVSRTTSNDEEEFRARTEQISKFAGVKRAGGVFYMEGDIEALDLSQGQKLHEHYDNLKSSLKDGITEAVNMPPVLLGRTRQGGFPNQDEMINAFEYFNGMTDQYRQFIADEFTRIAEHFVVPLLPSGQGFEIVPKTFIKSNATT